MEEIGSDHRFFERAVHHRQVLIEQLSNYDDKLADLYLSGTDPHLIEAEIIDKAIRDSLKS